MKQMGHIMKPIDIAEELANVRTEKEGGAEGTQATSLKRLNFQSA